MKNNKNKKAKKFPNKEGFPSKGGNDKKWFNNVKGLLDAITLPQFLIRKGVVDMGATGATFAVPSVAAIQVLPTLGSNEHDAVRTSIRKLYANLRRANTGATNYTEQDLLHYVYNLSIAIVVDRYIRRAYGVINNYDGLDASKPVSYFKAMGLDFDSFKDNMADLRLFINNNGIRLHSLIAGKCDLFERRAWMFDNIFKDGDTNKAQDILFTIPESLSYYDWDSNTYKNVVIPLYASNTVGRSYSNVITAVDAFMFNLTNNNKVSLISADLIKAYGLEQSKDYFTAIPEGYTVKPVYNEEVLNEIQNAKLAGNVSHNIFDDANGYLVEAPYTNTSATFGSGSTAYLEYINNNYINYYRNKLDILDYAVATRLSPRLTFDPNTGVTNIISFASEIPMYVRFVVTTNSASLGAIGTGIDPYGFTLINYDPFRSIILSNLNITDFLKSLWSYFDWMPMFVTLEYGYYDAAGILTYEQNINFTLFDFDNYAKLDSNEQISNINTACVQSLLWWPDVIKDQKVIVIDK